MKTATTGKLTSAKIKEWAAAYGLDGCAVGPMSRWEGAPRQMDPRFIFPEARSFIVVMGRIPRGVYRGIEEGTHWPNYTFYGYNRLNTLFIQNALYDLACRIEDTGYEAVPHFAGVPEVQPVEPQLRQGAPAPQVTAQFRIAGIAAGLGQTGHSKVFLTKRLGPRQRLAMILTDAELEYDSIQDQDLCDECMLCHAQCPGAVPGKDEKIHINIEGHDIHWGDVHMGKCTLTHHGLNKEIDPFLHQDFPGLDIKVREADGVSEEEAYRLTHVLAAGKFRKTKQFPRERAMGFTGVVGSTIGYRALCGARGCIRACMMHLEKKKKIENLFHNTFRKRPMWHLPESLKTAPRPEDQVE
jgi:epoxyqueuosine reductase